MGATIEIPPVAPYDTLLAVPDTHAVEIGDGAAGRLPFALAIFVSAFLLFQAQLLLGKEALPLFGGAAAVWTVCVLVFQLLFLAGYGYAHGLAALLPVRRQVMVHSVLLGISAVFMAGLAFVYRTPIGSGADWHPPPSASPEWMIAEFILRAIGLPFLLLSATSPLMQHWFVKTAPRRSPYRLYSLSNVGSLLGLLSYPFLVEPHLALGMQRWAWAAGYILFLICYGFSIRSVARAAGAVIPKRDVVYDVTSRDMRVGWPLHLAWISLAACGSVLLLATTNLICQDIAVSPFLWVLLLCLYLVSFIVCFESDRWYRREVFFPAFAVAVGFVVVVSLPNETYSFLAQLAAFSLALFTGCMVCHGEAARLRPRAESLTAFYLSIAAGGALGGVAVGLLAPRLFPNYWEYPLGVLGCIALVLVVAMQEPRSWWYRGRAPLALLIFAGAVLLASVMLASLWSEAAGQPEKIARYATLFLAGVAAFLYLRERRAGSTFAAPSLVRNAARIVLVLLTAGLLIPQKAALYHVTASSRNFYGVLSVVSEDSENYLALRYGSTVHGFQYRDPQRARLATGYYGPRSGANIVIRNWPQHPMRVGLVGMGVGTLAALAQPGDVYRFYEINPDVSKMSEGAHPTFTYLRDSPGRIEMVLGDARLSLEQEAGRGEFQKFDVLVLDAFSSDAIPMHLLTREAFRLYIAHLRGPASVIAVHISNKTLNLEPVLAGVARDSGFHALRVSPLLPTGPFSASDWILLSRDQASLSGEELATHSEPFPASTQPIVWTDNYCDLLSVVRWRE